MTNIIKLEHKTALAGVDRGIKRIRPSFLDSFTLRSHEKPFLELISIALNRDTLNSLIRAVEGGSSISAIHPESGEANAYLAKILREEVKQFSEKKRPLVELVLNGIDAKPVGFGGAYLVDVNINKFACSVHDNGKGMSLQKILDTLIIPFSSDKDELTDIGRFGIGFFSNLQYCLESPKRTAICVRTNDGGQAYELKIKANGDKVEQLVCSLRRIRSRVNGTAVEVSGIEFNQADLETYLADYFQFFDPRRAVIVVNGKPANLLQQRSILSTEYAIPVNVQHKEQALTQEVRMAIDMHKKNEQEERLRLYSQGVLVNSFALTGGSIHIDFPSAVYLVEGRDQFKHDSNYQECVSTAFEAVLKYCEDHQDNPAVLRDLRELVPQFVGIWHLTEATQRITKACFPERTYLVEDPELVKDSVNIRDFFGDFAAGELYIPRTNVARVFWEDVIPGCGQLIEDKAEVLRSLGRGEDLGEALEQVLGRRPKSIPLIPKNSKTVLVKLKSGEKTVSPVFPFGDAVYLNVDHPFLNDEGYVAGYGLRSAFARAYNADDKTAEAMLVGI